MLNEKSDTLDKIEKEIEAQLEEGTLGTSVDTSNDDQGSLDEKPC